MDRRGGRGTNQYECLASSNKGQSGKVTTSQEQLTILDLVISTFLLSSMDKHGGKGTNQYECLASSNKGQSGLMATSQHSLQFYI